MRHINDEQTPLLPLSNSQIQALKNDKSSKLGTFEGVFLPTALNVLSILMFLRFGFILGQMGILGSLLLLTMSYTITLLTTLSISAISTNGTVRGGGAYYMISRSLGPEFGGSIGIVFFIGQILNAALNVVGFVEPLLVNFGDDAGLIFAWLPDSYWFQFLYSTVLLAVCTCIALVGSGLVSRTANLLFVILLVATVSIPLSTLIVEPFELNIIDSYYSGPSWYTLRENLLPHFTKGAAGSQSSSKETFTNLFGVFFSATAGVFAGASMSGDLRKPSKSIPKGTLWGLLLTFSLYSIVIISMGISIPRDLLHKDVKVIQTINVSGSLVLLGEFSTALFSVIMGVIGAASLLQAIADDEIIPGLRIFSSKHRYGQNASIIFTWLLAQTCLFADINQIATFITMAFLMTFIVTNLACFLLKISAAPNFRPSFRFFNSKTAFAGVASCSIAMFIVDGLSATLVIIFLMFLFLAIHYTSPPKSWGDVSQTLIYHQVRKYLLRLRTDNVKYWRPQILLLVDDPRTCWNLMHFCNHLKKGGLYIIGHVIINDSFQDNYKEMKKQSNAWNSLRDISKLKAFVQIGLGPSLQWGVRNVYLGSGLGGMKPNITVLGFCDLNSFLQLKNPKQSQLNNQVDSALPTDTCRTEKKISVNQWVELIEDLFVMKSNVAVAKGFPSLQLPNAGDTLDDGEKPFIDLYPIQMSSIEVLDGKSFLSTNFDTYTLILQLGAILTTVPEWKHTHKLRIIVFVEFEREFLDERRRLKKLLDSLRIKAEIKVLCLSDGSLLNYNVLVKGDTKSKRFGKIDKLLKDEQWWCDLKDARRVIPGGGDSSDDSELVVNDDSEPSAKFEHLNLAGVTAVTKFKDILKKKRGRKYTFSNLQEAGLSLNMRTNTLPNSSKFLDTMDDDISVIDFDEESSDTSSLNLGKKVAKNSDDSTLKLNPDTSTNNRSSSNFSNSIRKIPQAEDTIKNLPRLSNKRQASVQRLLSPTPPLSSKPSKTNLRPNFSSVKIPESEIDESANGDGTTPSIYFVQDEDTGTNDLSSISSKSIHAQSKDRPSNETRPPITSWLSNFSKEVLDSGSIKSPRAPEFSLLNTEFKNISLDDSNSYNGDFITKEEFIEELNNLSFNDLPAKGQHLILNDLMKCVSGDRTDVIFSTLPAPIVGTHKNDEESLEYVENLQIWLDGLPPTLLVNSQTVTVTTAL